MSTIYIEDCQKRNYSKMNMKIRLTIGLLKTKIYCAHFDNSSDK